LLILSPPPAQLRDSDMVPQHRGKVRYGPELRVLIVGAGVAGLTLAALLEQRGFTPVVVEKSHEDRDVGHTIGLWPAGSRILKGLKLFSRFCELGVECSRYIVCNERGDTLRSLSFEPLARRFGPLVELGAFELIELLRSAVRQRDVRFGTRIRSISETPEGVVATFEDGAAELFDVVVGCDGIHSAVRHLVFGDEPLEPSGVTGWACWLPPDFVPPPEIVEYWGAGKFVGMYPARRRFCAVLALHLPPGQPDPVETRTERVRNAFHGFGGIVPWVLRELPAPEAMLPLEFSDLCVERWAHGRVVLIGDAAHAIVPTARMGASLAMESAAVLAEELCRTDSKFLTAMLEQFVQRRRPRVDRIQSQSRRLAKVMFAGNGLMTRLRDRAMRIIAEEPVLEHVEDMLSERI
jgi:2-polyprenyl-6-methoxyphenol hydroxylase-like FAD-dependent oxidoreductase